MKQIVVETTRKNLFLHFKLYFVSVVEEVRRRRSEKSKREGVWTLIKKYARIYIKYNEFTHLTHNTLILQCARTVPKYISFVRVRSI